MRKLILVLALCLVPVFAAAQTFSTTLTGAAEKPGPGDPDGSGVAVVSINGTTLAYTILVTNINAPIAAHIHKGTIDSFGAVDVNFTPTFVGGMATGTVTITAEQASAIAGNPAGYYVNVHTSDFQDGAVRGQLGAVSTGGGSLVSWMPAVGKVTTFVTDLRIVNESNATANVTLDYFQGPGPHTAPSHTRAVTVAPGEQEVLDDLIGTIGGANLGGLRITSDQAVTSTGRIINDLRSSGQGTTGFAFDALEASEAKRAGTLSFLIQASNADIGAKTGFRTNIGWFNASASPVTATFTARRTTDGSVIGTAARTIQAYEWVLLGAFQLFTGVAAADQVQPNFYVSWTSNAPLFVFASVTDNKTEDPILIR